MGARWPRKGDFCRVLHAGLWQRAETRHSAHDPGRYLLQVALGLDSTKAAGLASPLPLLTPA